MPERPVIFIPGGGVPPEASIPIVNKYSEFLEMGIDLVNYPEFVRPDSEISIESYRKHFSSIVRGGYGTEAPVVIGFSLGGYFAAGLLEDKSLNVDSLILVSPFLRKPKSTLKLLYNRGVSYLSEGKTASSWSTYKKENLVDDYRKYGRRILLQFLNVILKLEQQNGWILNSGVRKLVVIGKDDRVIPKYSPGEISGRVVYIDGQHDILIRRNSELPQVLRDFLSKQK